MVDPLIQPAWRIDRGVRIQPTAAQLGGGDLLEVVARRAVLQLGADGDFGHPQGGGRYPAAQEPAGAADGGRYPQQHRPALEATQRQADGQAWNRQGHRHTQRQFVTLGGGQVHDDRQCGQQRGEQGQGVQGQEQRALGRQPLVIQRVDNRYQRRRAQQASEQRLAAVPGGGDEKEGQDEKQTFLVDHLGGVAQQRFRDLAIEDLGEQLRKTVLQHQPQPAHQHDHRNPAGHALLAVYQDEAAHPRDETAECNHPWVALDQFYNALDEGRQVRHGRFTGCGKNLRQNNALARYSAPHYSTGLR